MNSLLPLISCLCVTKNRPAQLSRTIQCFIAQTYPNKELVVVYEETDEPTNKVLQSFASQVNFKLVAVENNNTIVSLGDLRNLSIDNATGEYCCQWDDDDWYHPTRITAQFELMQQAGKDACVLEQWLFFDGHTKQAYLSHKRYWEGSLLCSKILMQQYQYAKLAKGEDTPLITALRSKNQIHLIQNKPHLYIYNYHGNNTWQYQHFKGFFHYSKLLNTEQSKWVEDVLSQSISVEEGAKLLTQSFLQS